MVRDKVRTIAHPNICMMMPCFRANLPHKSDSAVVDRLDARSWVRIPGLDGGHGKGGQKLRSENLPRPRRTVLRFGVSKHCALGARQILKGTTTVTLFSFAVIWL
eukprot:SAG11_NODE_5509_length_1541_cov_19.004161_1_plen_105_part_00